EAVLEGVISSYRTRAYSYDKNDDISEYRSTMVVNAKFRQVEDGRLLWQGQVSWDDEYPAADDKSLQEDFEQEAIEEISLRLAEELFYRLLDDF
ncbi:MAG: molecular chaperone, partial [Desulfuromonadales bacterium]|nr:molecular chaperone [Desulfuromonadales bacterium]